MCMAVIPKLCKLSVWHAWLDSQDSDPSVACNCSAQRIEATVQHHCIAWSQHFSGTLVCRRNLSHGILLKSINANFISSMEENTTNFFWGFHVILSLEQQSLMPTTVTTGEHLNSCKPAGKPLMYKHRYAENYGSQCVCVCPWLPLLPGNFKCEL